MTSTTRSGQAGRAAVPLPTVLTLHDGTSTSTRLAALTDHAAALERELGIQRSLRRAAEERVAELEQSALVDQLTGILNRAGLFEERARKTPTAVAVFDLDSFKQVNDKFGHRLGNAVLCEVAKRLDRVLPGRVAHLSGDEYAALIDEDDPLAVAGVLSRAISGEEIPLPGGQGVTVTTSVGVALGAGVEDIEDLLHRADVAAYCSKRAGRAGQRGVPVLWQWDTRMPKGVQRARDGGACPGCGGCAEVAA